MPGSFRIICDAAAGGLPSERGSVQPGLRSIAQGPLSLAPCQTLALRFAAFAPLCGLIRGERSEGGEADLQALFGSTSHGKATRGLGGLERTRANAAEHADVAAQLLRPRHTAMQKWRNVTLRFLARGDRKCSLDDGQIPNSRGVSAHVSTGYNTGEANRRASRNGRVSDLPPEIPTVTIRFLFHHCPALFGQALRPV
jgi:hypothetical protein